MNSIDEIYLELFSVWLERLKTKKYSFDTFVFERNVGIELMELAQRLDSLSWSIGGYKRFKIFHPEREISAPFYVDRIAEAWFTEKFIKPYIVPKVIFGNMACQTGKGSKKLMDCLNGKLDELFDSVGSQFWFLQFDMKGYYDNLSHRKIVEQFSGMPLEGQRLLLNVLDSWESKVNYAWYEGDRFGIPKGCLVSQWIGVLYLNELDHLIEARRECLFYARYMDDGIILCKDKADCRFLYGAIKHYLIKNKMGIRMHPQKTCYAPFSRGFNFCGWHYCVKDDKVCARLRTSKKKEIKSKFRALQWEYSKSRVDWDYVRSVMQGTMNYLKWGNTEKLRKYLCRYFFFQRDCLPFCIDDWIHCWNSKIEYEDALADLWVAEHGKE